MSNKRKQSEREEINSSSSKTKHSSDDYSLLDQFHSQVAYGVALTIKQRIQAEVDKYIESDDYKAFLEAMKRRARERAMEEIQAMIDKEIEHKRANISQLADDQILLQNKLKAEARQRSEYEARQLELLNAEKLKEIQLKQQLEVRVLCYY